MKILIPDIPKEGLDVVVDETLLFDGEPSTVSGSLRVEKSGGEIIVSGNLIAKMELQCGRCLRKYPKDLAIPVDVCYHPIEDLVPEEYHEVTADELDLDFYSGEELDISVLLVEQIALNAPMKPLCDDLCKGLCPKCGADLNVNPCSCVREWVDPRFLPLKTLISRGKE